MSFSPHLFSRKLYIITWTTLTLYFMLFKLLSFVRWPSPKLADWFYTSFLWMSGYHFVKGNLIFITCFQQMKWLQMCYVQTLGANKIHFPQEGKAHIMCHFLFNVMRTWATYSSKGRECCKANRFIISWKLSARIQNISKRERVLKRQIDLKQAIFFFSFQCLYYLPNKFAFFLICSLVFL